MSAAIPTSEGTNRFTLCLYRNEARLEQPSYEGRPTVPMRSIPARGYFRPITMESGPTRCSVRVALNPASVIHSMQSPAV